MCLHVGGHPDAIVAHAHSDVIASRDGAIGRRPCRGCRRVDRRPIERDVDRAAERQRVAGVDDQVEDDLLEVVRIDEDRRVCLSSAIVSLMSSRIRGAACRAAR